MARNSALNVHTLADVDQRRPILAQDEPSVRRPHCEASRVFRRLGKFERLASRIIARVQRVRSREDCVMSRAGEIAFFHADGGAKLVAIGDAARDKLAETSRRAIIKHRAYVFRHGKRRKRRRRLLQPSQKLFQFYGWLRPAEKVIDGFREFNR